MNINEIELLLTLNGGKRIPHLEEEIFTCKHVIILSYLRGISPPYHNNNIDTLFLIYVISADIIKGRWPEAEKIILLPAHRNNIWVSYYRAEWNIHK